MAQPETPSTLSLEVRRRFRQPPAQVWAAWTKAEALSRWFAPSDALTVDVIALDPRPGGAWRLEIRQDGTVVRAVGGTYQAVEPPAVLAFTWRWDSSTSPDETLVTVRLAPADGGTEMVLTHERFPNEGMRTAHSDGWHGCFERLAAVLAP